MLRLMRGIKNRMVSEEEINENMFGERILVTL